MSTSHRIFAIIGQDIGYSLSPIVYNTLFTREKVNASYQIVDIAPRELKTFVQAVTMLGISGFNVTIPHKQAIIKYTAKLDKTAQVTQSVNMVINRHGKLYGYDTDYYGIRQTIEKKLKMKVKDSRVALIGSGGVAHSVYYYLVRKAPSSIVVYHHSLSRRRMFGAFAHRLPLFERYYPISFESKIKDIEQCDLCINCTPQSVTKLISKRALDSIKWIFEMRYGNYPLLSRYHLSGNYMLAAQAAENFRIMTGKNVSKDQILKIIKQAIKK